LPEEYYEADSGLKVTFEYDNFKREIKRVFSSGAEIITGYNSDGYKSFCIIKDRLGIEISADYVLYDEKGRISYVFNKNLEYVHYNYDDKGHLLAATYPYSQELKLKSLSEAEVCGFYIQNDAFAGEEKTLPLQVENKLTELLNQAGSNKQIRNSQFCWTETYSYNSCGSLASVQNNLCKILYEYDDLNRLSSKYSENTKKEGMHFVWNDNNCLTEVSSKFYAIFLEYDGTKLVKLINRDFQNNNERVLEFSYDGLGRRNYICVDKEDEFINIFDGFTSNILLRAKLNSEVNYQSQENRSDDERYRTVQSDDYIHVRSKVKTDVKTKAEYQVNNSRNYASTVYFYNKNNPIFSINDYDNSFIKNLEIMGNNFNENLSYTLNGEGESVSESVYDTYGNVINKGNNKRYSGAQDFMEENLVFYTLNNRDYVPDLKCFTTIDPIRDGTNWYSFCSYDPVNYKDISGLKKISATDRENFDYSIALYEIGLCYNYSNYKDSGDDYYIPSSLNCAEVSYNVDMLASKFAGISDYSTKASIFADYIDDGNLNAAANSVWSGDFWGNDSNSVTQTSAGYDRDFLRVNSSVQNSSEALSNNLLCNIEKLKKEQVEKNLTNPDIIQPGTVLAWQKSSTPALVGGKQQGDWKGHTVTVLARTFDENGLVTGFTYIEGHTGGEKTQIGFMNVGQNKVAADYDGSYTTIDSWMGEFRGTYEIEKRSECEK